jgi:hypothetical protein
VPVGIFHHLRYGKYLESAACVSARPHRTDPVVFYKHGIQTFYHGSHGLRIQTLYRLLCLADALAEVAVLTRSFICFIGCAVSALDGNCRVYAFGVYH